MSSGSMGTLDFELIARTENCTADFTGVPLWVHWGLLSSGVFKKPAFPPYLPLYFPPCHTLSISPFCPSSPILRESGPSQSSNSQQNDGWSGVPCLHQDHLCQLVGRRSPVQLHKPRPSTLLDHKVFRWRNWGSGGLVEFCESQSPEPELRHCSLPGIRALHHWKLLDLWDPRCSEFSKWIDGGSSADIAAAPGCLVQTRWTTAGTAQSGQTWFQHAAIQGSDVQIHSQQSDWHLWTPPSPQWACLALHQRLHSNLHRPIEQDTERHLPFLLEWSPPKWAKSNREIFLQQGEQSRYHSKVDTHTLDSWSARFLHKRSEETEEYVFSRSGG